MSAPDFTRTGLDYSSRFDFRVFPLYSPDPSSPRLDRHACGNVTSRLSWLTAFAAPSHLQEPVL